MQLSPLRPLLTLLLVVPLAEATAAQSMPSPPPPVPNPRDVPIDSNLWRLEQRWLARSGQASDLRALQSDLEQDRYVFDEARRVHVEVERRDGLDVPLGALFEAHGGYVDRQVPGRADAWVAVSELTRLARALPKGSFLVPARQLCLDDVVGEGPSVTNSETYAAGGADGSGRRIAIIDGGFTGLSAARSNGDAPALSQTNQFNFASGTFESGGTHGVGCVEAAFDHAPGAAWDLYRVDSVTDVLSAVSESTVTGVNVISMSLSYYNQGWNDDSGTACAAANLAGVSGMLFFTSAGNRAQSHFQGVFEDGDGDGWTSFDGTDESIDVSVDFGDTVNLTLAWDGNVLTNYDLYLLDSNTGAILASSTNVQTTSESLTWTNRGAATRAARIAVFKVTGANEEFELFDHNGATWLEHTVAASSTTSPSNTTHPNLVSVAAVDQADFASPSGSFVIKNYSSNGPTNNGVIKPDLAGPTDTTGFTYSNGFGGTSCATPNVAGVATAFWSADPLLDAGAVRWLLQAHGVVLRDWGVAGDDNVYGAGGLRLSDFAPDTLWLDAGYNNFLNLRQFPLSTLAGAEAHAVPGGRIMAIGALNYAQASTLTKPLQLRSVATNKLFGK